MSRTERRLQTERAAAVREALARAGRRRLPACKSRATSSEPRTSTPCCRCCTYATTLQEGSRELLVCMNCPERPGHMRVTDPSHCCRVFQKRRPRVHRKAPLEPLDDAIRHIPLTKGRYAIIDAADFERVARVNGGAAVSGNRAYAYGRMNGRHVSLHRFLANALQATVGEHIDHNGLTNRRSNPRLHHPAEPVQQPALGQELAVQGRLLEPARETVGRVHLAPRTKPAPWTIHR